MSSSPYEKMAESLLSTIASAVLVKLGSLALQEVRLARALEPELKKLEENMVTIKAVLLDAEEQQAHNHELRIWLGRLKNFCFDAEDVLDELDYEVLHRQFVKQNGSTSTKVRRHLSQSNPLAVRIAISRKIKGLNERLDELATQKSRFHLRELVDPGLVLRRQRELTDSLLRTSNVIGREVDKERIMKFMLQSEGEKSEGGSVSVIPIVGIGGLGKTTLAKLLYNDKRVDENFQLKMWVCVSEELEKKEIMVKMIKFLTHQNPSDLDPEQLQTCIRDQLKSNRFLLVLDDVWSDDRYKWSELRDLLEEGDNGSKVIVTTRSASVARTVGTVSAYNLKGLPYEDCLLLFKKWAFNKGEEEHYPNRMEIGKDIVKKCGGLPLAVRTLATLLYERNEDHYWKFIRDNEVWELEQKEGDILPTLKLSYDQMKSHLKPCFAICSIFPKDYEFNSYWLPRVWMAHGLLQSSDDGQELEDIGLQYMKELYSKSFFQDFVDHGGFFVFKMHDLVHDLALSVAQGECAMVTVRSKISEGIRHMSFFDEALLEKKIPEFPQMSSHLQTILFQSKAEGPTMQSFVFNCISSCKYLRMLDLARSSFAVLPSSIGALKHLRYLNLSRNYRIKELPDSICYLHNLQTLCLDGCLRLEKLPRDIRSMIKLRCLVMTVKQKCLPEDGIGSLKSLRFLSIGECSNLESLLEGMQHLTSLHSLHISSCENLVSLPNLKYLTTLRTLLIKDCKKLNLMEVAESQDFGLSLQSLILHELPQLITLPKWLLSSSKTLQCLSIRYCVNFSSLPLWIQNFTVLKKIEIERCPDLLKKPGDFWPRVAHVPQVSLKSMLLEDLGLGYIPPVYGPYARSYYGGSSWPDGR